MLKISYLFFSLVILASAKIHELDDGNFYSNVGKFQMSLIVFHTPWCGQCKKLMKILPEIVKKLQVLSLRVEIVTVDCENEGKNVCKDYGITGFPILKSFRDGKEYGTFEDVREIEKIVDFIKIEAAPVLNEIDESTNVEDVVRSENRPVVVSTFRASSTMEGVITSLAEKLRRKMSFLYKHISDGDPTIRFYQQPILWNTFEDKFVEYQGKENASEIQSFLLRNHHGLVGIRTISNKNDFNVPLAVVYYDIDFAQKSKVTNYWRNRVLKVAKKYHDKLQFAISSATEFFDELRFFDMKLPVKTPIAIVVLETNERFIQSENFTAKSFDSFLEGILTGKVDPYLKSQKPPKKNDSYIVQAVGSTFYDLVIRHANDTMVKLYAPWCGPCKRLAPIYKKLAEILRDENITLVDVDATENDVPLPYTPTGYPTIYWSTKEYRMNPIIYEGNRTIEEFIKFIAKHASNELKYYDRNGDPKSLKTEL